MADTRLRDFIDSGLRSGKTRDEIGEALRSAGWSKEQISDGMRFFADVPFEVPVPRPRAQLSARDAFMYLLMYGTLYISAFQFGSLLFSFINMALPAGLPEYAVLGAGDSIRFATSSLIIAFPIFVWLHLKIQREVRLDATRGQSAIRRWLTYLTLLIAAAVILGDSITLVYSLLSGEMTLRFVLKVLVVAAIAGSGFAYFLHLVREDGERAET